MFEVAVRAAVIILNMTVNILEFRTLVLISLLLRSPHRNPEVQRAAVLPHFDFPRTRAQNRKRLKRSAFLINAASKKLHLKQ